MHHKRLKSFRTRVGATIIGFNVTCVYSDSFCSFNYIMIYNFISYFTFLSLGIVLNELYYATNASSGLLKVWLYGLKYLIKSCVYVLACWPGYIWPDGFRKKWFFGCLLGVTRVDGVPASAENRVNVELQPTRSSIRTLTCKILL